MTYYPNKSDYDDNFWKHNYKVLVTAQGIEFIVSADNEQEAIDYIIDYCEDNHLDGLVSDGSDLDEIEREEFIQGGNHGLYLTTRNIHIERIKRDKEI